MRRALRTKHQGGKFRAAALLGLVASVCALAGFAPPTAEAALRIERAVTAGSSNAVKADRSFWGSTGYEGTGYLYAPTNGRAATFQSLSLELGSKLSGSLLEFGANTNLLLNIRPTVHPYFEVPNLYLGNSRDLAPVQLRLGRKLEPWSQLDETWQLGIFQPRFRWDYLHPQSVGLLGGFLEVNQPGLRVMGFASPIYIPERGVPITVDNGRFSSPSAWFIPPSSRISLFDQDTPVRYDLVIPTISEIVFQPSAGVLARIGGSEGFWASGAFAKKPLNQLLLGHDAHFRLDELEVPVKIAPRVAYHRVSSLEAGYTAKRFATSLSVLHEDPVDKSLGSNWTEQTVTPATAISPSFQFTFGNSRAGASTFCLAYLWRWGGNAPDHGRDAGGKSVFEARYPFERAVRFSVVSPGLFGMASDDLTGSTRVIYDSTQDGAIWSTEMRYQIQSQWRLNIGADLLATQVTSDVERTDSGNFIRRYQVHNRIQAGVSYVF